MSDGIQHLTGLVWSVTDLLRGDYKRSDYGRVIVPFTVLRRLECALEPTRAKVADLATYYNGSEMAPEGFLQRASGHAFYNKSDLTLRKIAADPQNAVNNLEAYVAAFSGNVRGILDRFGFAQQIRRLDDANLLHRILGKFADLDLRPDAVSDDSMGHIFEELIRRFAEYSNETAGEHFTPREVIRLMVDILVASDTDVLSSSGSISTIMDPACGTGGMLSVAQERIKALNPDALVEVFGQELNPESWAICRSHLVVKGQNPENIAFGNSISEDRHAQQKFDYLLANPPFGVDWKVVKEEVEREHRSLGEAGRFGAGLPRINDGSLLFLQHMISKMKPVDANGGGGSRLAIIFNGSPLFTGTAGSGESQIRQWILENDWLEGIIALPDRLFYNTGIPTYFWILTNRKSPQHEGKVVLLNARDQWQKMRKSLGDKSKELGNQHIREITDLYAQALEVAKDPEHPLHPKVKAFHNEDFGYQRITVERPLRLRFEITAETLAVLAAAKPVQKLENAEAFVAAVRTLLGCTWRTKTEALKALRAAVVTANQKWPAGAPFNKALRDSIGVRDPRGELQKVKGAPEPDTELRTYKSVALHEEVEDYLDREIRTQFPDAWIDPTRTRIGYEIRTEMFFAPPLKAKFKPLEIFCRLETERIKPSRDESGAENIEEKPSHLKETLPHLRMQDLHSVDSALDLPSPPEDGPALTPCGSGDIVGRQGNWRLLPSSFGPAITHLTVLHPLEPRTGRAICEWLNSSSATGIQAGPNLMKLPVPTDVIQEEDFDDLLENVQSARQRLRVITSGILPNIFSGSDSTIQELRRTLQATDAEAQLIGEISQALEDPVSRAEWSYPFHVAALARRYRISSITTSTHPAERMDSLLKLGEGIARTLGIITLADLATVDRDEFAKVLRQQFRKGATFGTWTTILNKGAELAGRTIADPDGHGLVYSLLNRIKDFRNNGPAHAHGVRETHEIGEAADELERLVLSTLRSVAWLSSTHWDWVERCEYLDEASYNLVKQRLRGSHPAWEPIEESSQQPMKPKHIYARNGRTHSSLDLWPLASVDVCSKCNARELFLIDKVQQGILTLRSLREHSKEINYPDL